MEPDNMTTATSKADMSLQDQTGGAESSPEDQTETVLEVAPATPTGGSSTLQSPGTTSDGREGLQRTTSKIASLRATFETRIINGSPDKSEGGKSPGRRREHEFEATRLRDEEIAKLRDQLKKEMELKQAFEDKCRVLEEDLARSRAKLEQQEGAWLEEMERQSRALKGERDKAQEESVEIKRQLLGLKRNISMAGRVEHQVPDSSFTSEMQHLYHETQNWIVNSFRRVRLDKTPGELLTCLDIVVEPKHLDYLRPLFREWDPAVKLAILQAVTTRYLMEIWDDVLLFGLPAWRVSVRKTAETMSAILPPAAYLKWRSITLHTLKQSAVIKDSVDSAAKALSDMICITLISLTGAEETASMSSSLIAIVKRAVSLSHVFRVQRAQYEFILPEPGSPFDPARMDHIALESDSSSKTIRCATFPLVLKRGDESGEATHLRNIVIKAKVLCFP